MVSTGNYYDGSCHITRLKDNAGRVQSWEQVMLQRCCRLMAAPSDRYLQAYSILGNRAARRSKPLAWFGRDHAKAAAFRLPQPFSAT